MAVVSAHTSFTGHASNGGHDPRRGAAFAHESVDSVILPPATGGIDSICRAWLITIGGKFERAESCKKVRCGCGAVGRSGHEGLR